MTADWDSGSRLPRCARSDGNSARRDGNFRRRDGLRRRACSAACFYVL